MYPHSIALIDRDPAFSLPLAQHLRGLGIAVFSYVDGPSLLADASAFTREFFVGDLTGPGLSGIDLIKTLRHRSDAGILVVSAHTDPKLFHDVLMAGADMHLSQALRLDHHSVAAAIVAVQRRAGRQPVTARPWTLHRMAGELVAPDGARVGLSDIDSGLLECFVDAQGQPVLRQMLAHRLGRHGQQGADGLNAVIYRLRRRIERATPLPVPLQSKSRVGYLFKAPLQVL
jgi:two-component system, OmpR family, response regulator